MKIKKPKIIKTSMSLAEVLAPYIVEGECDRLIEYLENTHKRQP